MINKENIISLIDKRIININKTTYSSIKNNSQLFKETSRVNSAIINELNSLKDEVNNINNTLSSSINKNNNQYTTEEVIAELYKDKSKIFKRVNDENFIIYRGNYGDIMMKIKDIIIKPLPIFNYYQDLWIEKKGDNTNELSNSCYLNNR